MKVKELIRQLSECDSEDEVEIYLHHTHPLMTDSEIEDDPPTVQLSYEYVLCDVKVNRESGWAGIITLELGKLRGC